MWTLLTTWVTGKIRIIEWATLGVILALTLYLGYHTHTILDEAATAKQTARIVEAAPKVITATQTITKVIHDANDKCASTHIPNSIAQQLR